MAKSINCLRNLSDDNVTLNLKFYPQELYLDPVWHFIGVVEATSNDDNNSGSGNETPEEDNELIYDGGGVNG